MNPFDNMLWRARLDETDDTGKQQKMSLLGRVREKIGGQKSKVPRLQGYGLSSHPPKGAQGFFIAMGGYPDQVFCLGIEHPDHRPTNLAEGELKLYDDQGQFVHIKRDGIHIETGKTVTIKAPKIVLESADIRLGSDSASRELAAKGTIDTGGFVDTANLLTKVKGE